MSNRAWMPLHIHDYITDTDHLTATEHGAYLLLIMKYWRDGGLPADEGMIRRYAKLTAEQWAESREKLLAFFAHQPSRYSQADRVCGRGIRRRAPSSVRRAVLARDGEICTYCKSTTGPFHVDHKTPWSLGGAHSLENLCVACEACNIAKSDIPYEDWMELIQ